MTKDDWVSVKDKLPDKDNVSTGEKWIKIKSATITSNDHVHVSGIGDVRYTTTIYPEDGKPMVVTVPRNADDTVYMNNSESEEQPNGEI